MKTLNVVSLTGENHVLYMDTITSFHRDKTEYNPSLGPDSIGLILVINYGNISSEKIHFSHHYSILDESLKDLLLNKSNFSLIVSKSVINRLREELIMKLSFPGSITEDPIVIKYPRQDALNRINELNMSSMSRLYEEFEKERDLRRSKERAKEIRKAALARKPWLVRVLWRIKGGLNEV